MLSAARRAVEVFAVGRRTSILGRHADPAGGAGHHRPRGGVPRHPQQGLRTHVVAGVTPGKAGQDVEGIPVFNTVADAVEETGANTAMVFVPPRFATDALFEAIESGVETIVCITEGIPAHDMIGVYTHLRRGDQTLVGPNCPGVITPGVASVGIMPTQVFAPGRVGLLSRSGTLTYQISKELAASDGQEAPSSSAARRGKLVPCATSSAASRPTPTPTSWSWSARSEEPRRRKSGRTSPTTCQRPSSPTSPASGPPRQADGPRHHHRLVGHGAEGRAGGEGRRVGAEPDEVASWSRTTSRCNTTGDVLAPRGTRRRPSSSPRWCSRPRRVMWIPWCCPPAERREIFQDILDLYGFPADLQADVMRHGQSLSQLSAGACASSSRSWRRRNPTW